MPILSSSISKFTKLREKPITLQLILCFHNTDKPPLLPSTSTSRHKSYFRITLILSIFLTFDNASKRKMISGWCLWAIFRRFGISLRLLRSPTIPTYYDHKSRQSWQLNVWALYDGWQMIGDGWITCWLFGLVGNMIWLAINFVTGCICWPLLCNDWLNWLGFISSIGTWWIFWTTKIGDSLLVFVTWAWCNSKLLLDNECVWLILVWRTTNFHGWKCRRIECGSLRLELGTTRLLKME